MSQTWEYMVIPLNISIKEGQRDASGDIARQFTSLVNGQAKQGWEYYSFEVLPVRVNPGCMFLGAQPTTTNYWCVVFRIPVVTPASKPAQPFSAPARISTTYSTPPTSSLTSPPPPLLGTRFYYQDLNGDTQGPISAGALKQMMGDGSVGHDTMVCAETGERWQKLEDAIPL